LLKKKVGANRTECGQGKKKNSSKSQLKGEKERQGTIGTDFSKLVVHTGREPMNGLTPRKFARGVVPPTCYRENADVVARARTKTRQGGYGSYIHCGH